jgi:hypothetical protein
MEFNLGHLLEATAQNGTIYRFQNFAVSTDVTYLEQTFAFIPFGFSGATASLTGDNLDASIILTQSNLARAWEEQAIAERWLGEISVCLVNPETRTVSRVLYEYVGTVANGGWSPERIELRLNTVMDSVKASIPNRRLLRNLVGNLPITGQVRV